MGGPLLAIPCLCVGSCAAAPCVSRLPGMRWSKRVWLAARQSHNTGSLSSLLLCIYRAAASSACCWPDAACRSSHQPPCHVAAMPLAHPAACPVPDSASWAWCAGPGGLHAAGEALSGQPGPQVARGAANYGAPQTRDCRSCMQAVCCCAPVVALRPVWLAHGCRQGWY